MSKLAKAEVLEIIDKYSNSLDLFEMKQELKRYNLLDEYEENQEEYDNYIEATWY